MIRNTKKRFDETDRRFEIAVRILRCTLWVVVLLCVIFYILEMIEAHAFLIVPFLKIFITIAVGIVAWAGLEIMISFFTDIKFIRNGLQNPAELENEPAETDENISSVTPPEADKNDPYGD